MSNEQTSLAVAEPRPVSALIPQSMNEAMRLAELMSKAELVPKHLQGRPADCLLVVEQASRWGMSPFAVAQATSVISGKLMYEGKLVAAVVNARGDLSQRLRYKYDGEGPHRSVRVIGQIRGETEPREVEVKLRDARTSNQQWDKQPDQQLMYHGARVWARRHMPELMLGVYSPEEFDEQAGVGYTPPPSAPSGITRYKDGITADGRFDVEADEVDQAGLELVPVYDATTGEQVREEPKLTDKQALEIDGLLIQLSNILPHPKFCATLRRTFSKEKYTELSVNEAAKLITSLQKRANKQLEKLERVNEDLDKSFAAMKEDAIAARAAATTGADDAVSK